MAKTDNTQVKLSSNHISLIHALAPVAPFTNMV